MYEENHIDCQARICTPDHPFQTNEVENCAIKEGLVIAGKGCGLDRC